MPFVHRDAMRSLTLVLVLAAGMALTSGALADHARGEATAAEGGGCISRGDNPCVPLLTGTEVPIDTWIVAGAGGTTVASSQGARIHFDQGATFRLLHRTKLLRPAAMATTLELRDGRMQIDVPEESKATVLVHTSQGIDTIAAAGTTVVKHSPASVSVAAVHGAPSAGPRGRAAVMKTATVRLFPREGAGETRPLPEAPAISESQRVGVAGTTFGTATSLTWGPVTTARSYQVEVRRIADSVPVAREVVDEWQTTASFPLLPPGSYWGRVRSLDVDGFGGEWSPPVRIDVVGAKLPPGSSVTSDGRILVPRKRQVSFVNAEALDGEVIGEPPARGLAAVGPKGGNTEIVTLRRPDDGAEAKLRISPVPVRASIELSPRGAASPLQPISIIIHLSALGGLAHLETSVHPVVTLGKKELALDWIRSGDTMAASISPDRLPSRDETLHVEVRDREGRVLGKKDATVAAF
jgi:hypothetical protein